MFINVTVTNGMSDKHLVQNNETY